METVEIPVDNLSPGSRFQLQIPRTGDLAGRMYLEVGVPAVTGDQLPYSADPIQNTKVAWVRRLGHALVNSVELDIGGSNIDKHFGVWLDVWYELTHTVEQERGYGSMVGDVADLTTLTGGTAEAGSSGYGASSEVVLPAHQMYIPLQFWFCRNTGLALPLIALQYHEVRLYVEFNDVSSLVVWSGAAAPDMSKIQFEDCGVLVEYIYLDSEERRRFAQVGHEYLIEQVQFPGQANLNSVGSSSTFNSQKFKMDFNHPCKEVVFALKSGAFSGQALKSSLLGNRGRFLTYTNKSDENSWDSAVDYAARNLANGMVVVKTTSPGSNWNQIVLLGSANIGVGSTGSVTQVSGSTTWNFIITNNGAASITVEDLPLWVLNDGGLTKNGQGLANSVQEVTVAITVTAVNTGAMTTIDNSFGTNVIASTTAQYLPTDSLVVSNHTLNLTDVSVPVEDFVDTRAHVEVGDAINPWDVTVVQPSNYGLRLDGAGNPVSTGNITLNGHDRFSVEDGDYFNYYQPLQHHTRTPADGVNVYSFALHPEQHQPSGTCNMSRIDSAYLVLKFVDRLRENSNIQLDYTTDSVFYIFALNYNVLRIMSGMGGLAYSN